MVDRTAEAAEVAAAVGVSVDSIGRYAREGRIPFSTTPGGHRRFSIDEVRHALGASDVTARALFAVPSSTQRRRQIRAVSTTSAQVTAFLDSSEAIPRDAGLSAADELLAGAWRVQRSVPLASAGR